MSASIAWEHRSAIGLAAGGSRAGAQAADGAGRRLLRRLVGLLHDAVFLLLIVWLLPVAILLVGIPVALLVGVVLEMSHGVFLGLLTTAAPVVGVTAGALFLVRHLVRR